MHSPHSSPLRILYYGGAWPTNIGNAFIDYGALGLLRLAAPDAHVAFASEAPRWFFRHLQEPTSRLSRLLRWCLTCRVRRIRVRRGVRQTQSGVGGPGHRRRGADGKDMGRALDVAAVSACDVVVFAGMAMCREFVQVNGPPLLALARRGVRVLLLGTGAQAYTEEESDEFGRFLTQLRPVGFVSRDDRSYDQFASFVPNAMRCIDCGFFVPETYKPLAVTIPPFIVATFDSVPEPSLEMRGRRLVRCHHSCWGPVPRAHLKGDTLISDIPEDYLTLYASAEEVHSDRVHACVAALAYGRAARLYNATPRGSLFEAVGASRIRQQLTVLDMAALAEKKAAQVEFTRRTVNSGLAK